MNDCYICNSVINYKKGDWSPYIIHNIAYRKCGKCTENKNQVLNINIPLKDIEPVKKILKGFGHKVYLRQNKIHIIYNSSSKYLIDMIFTDLSIIKIDNEFKIRDEDKYESVVRNFR